MLARREPNGLESSEKQFHIGRFVIHENFPVPVPVISKINVVVVAQVPSMEKDQRLSGSLIKVSRVDPVDPDLVRIFHDSGG